MFLRNSTAFGEEGKCIKESKRGISDSSIVIFLLLRYTGVGYHREKEGWVQ